MLVPLDGWGEAGWVVSVIVATGGSEADGVEEGRRSEWGEVGMGWVRRVY